MLDEMESNMEMQGNSLLCLIARSGVISKM